ncbi:hypothetical protein [Paucibacter sp. KCTC 42545]|uniref:hypothetical protein n=1 Tax=Paucibacter sp. KCTC 42545 TaxID=1768242 RepID=UPI000733B8CC|nr:hypothetical protein [Paucibacter sp. KCTC 42545]ALT78682.1 hypothetical protein AT984_17280 [Paucibacter sp. KCTC 42545]
MKSQLALRTLLTALIAVAAAALLGLNLAALSESPPAATPRVVQLERVVVESPRSTLAPRSAQASSLQSAPQS